MTRTSGPLLALAASTLLTTAACGGGGVDAPPVETSVDRSAQLSAMDAETTQTLCDELAAYADAVITEEDSRRLMCYSFALVFSFGDRSACQASVDECLNDSDEDGLSFSVDTKMDVCEGGNLGTCDATVDELLACQEAQASQVLTLLSSLSCSTSPSRLASLGNLPAACRGLEQRCPDLFPEDDDDDGDFSFEF